jgi:hypothetical protein
LLFAITATVDISVSGEDVVIEAEAIFRIPLRPDRNWRSIRQGTRQA